MDIVSWAFTGTSGLDPHKPIFIDASEPSEYITAVQARRLIRQLIAGFKAAGLQHGQTVCILTLSSIYYPLLYLAVVGAGGRVAGGNPGHTVFELQHLLKQCSVRFIITENSLLDKATKASRDCGIDSQNILLCNGHDTPTEDSRSWRNLLMHGESDWQVLDEAESAKTVAAYYSTSGTTGAPKFAAVSHAYQVISGKYIEAEVKAKPYEVSRLVSLPLMHAFAAPLVHIAALRSGTSTFIMPRFSASAFVDTISRHGVTEFPVVPSMLISLAAAPSCTTAALRSVREVICAGAPLSTSVAASFSGLLTAPSARLIQLYGATEAGWISSTPYRAANNNPHSAASTASNHDSLPKTSAFGATTASATAANGKSAFPIHDEPTPTVGMPLLGYALRLVHTTSGLPISGTEMPGSLQVRAPYPFMHYVGAEQATRDSFTADGWLKTGDIATRDTAGRYYIVDREKDMIKVRGWQVAPAEIEAAFASHPAVGDCAVLGTEDKKGTSGEVPWAFVTLTPESLTLGSGIDEKSLKIWLRERLAGYKVPETIVIVDQVPRNPAGKILRRVLREKYLTSATSSSPSASASSLPSMGTVLPTPRVEKSLGDILPQWTMPSIQAHSSEVKGENVSVDEKWPRLATISGTARRWNASSLLATLIGEHAHLWLLFPAGVTLSLGLCLWRSDSVTDLRRWLFR